MAVIKPLLGHSPEFGTNCFLSETAVIIGQFKCGDGCSFWYGSVVRGDVNSITFGHKVNVQDNATVHCTYEKFPTVVGNNVSIGHNAIVHGSTVEDNVLIGMGAIVMDDAIVGEFSIVGAGSLVTERTHIPPRTLALGTPAKPVRTLKPHEIDSLRQSAQHYIHAAQSYLDAGIGRPLNSPSLPT